MRVVCVTGVSSGIGYGIARILTRAGVHVFGTVRSGFDGERLASEFGAFFHPLIMDVTNQDSIDHAVQTVSHFLGGRKLWALVNNAGVSILGPMLYQPLEEFETQVNVNLTGTVRMIKSFLPLLGTDKMRTGSERSTIINVSSMGGKLGVPLLTGYTASKFALEGLSESLRRELRPFGINVVIVGPGAINTKIFDKSLETNFARYEHTEYNFALRSFIGKTQADREKALPPEALGYLVMRILTSRRPKLRYAVMRHGWIVWPIIRSIPARWFDFMFGKMLQLEWSRLPATHTPTLTPALAK